MINLQTFVGRDLVRPAVTSALSVTDLRDDFMLTQSLWTFSGGLVRLSGLAIKSDSVCGSVVAGVVGSCWVSAAAVRLPGEL